MHCFDVTDGLTAKGANSELLEDNDDEPKQYWPGSQLKYLNSMKGKIDKEIYIHPQQHTTVVGRYPHWAIGTIRSQDNTFGRNRWTAPQDVHKGIKPLVLTDFCNLSLRARIHDW